MREVGLDTYVVYGVPGPERRRFEKDRGEPVLEEEAAVARSGAAVLEQLHAGRGGGAVAALLSC